MKSLRKDDQLNIRCRRKVKRRVEKAAQIESRRRVEAGGDVIEAGPLVLELAMPGIDRILAGQRLERRRQALATTAQPAQPVQ